MRVMILDVDGTMENLALMRIAAYHRGRGDTVIFKRLANHRKIDIERAQRPLWGNPDRVYLSCLFKWNKMIAEQIIDLWTGVDIRYGGTGIDFGIELPSEIQEVAPDYSLYGQDRVVGFISRGCPNKCPWCVVWRKEGTIKRKNTAKNIVSQMPNPQSAVFLDNNFLAMDGYYRDLEWLARRKIPIDFNQGLDAKFITKDNARLLNSCKWEKGPRLALDADGRESVVRRAVDFLSDAGIAASRITLFILIGFSGLQSDVSRLLVARDLGVNAYPMGFRDLGTGEEPARGWDRKLYNKYRRLIIRLPQAESVWSDFRREVCV